MKHLLNIAALLAVVVAFGLIYAKNKPHTDAGIAPVDVKREESAR